MFRVTSACLGRGARRTVARSTTTPPAATKAIAAVTTATHGSRRRSATPKATPAAAASAAATAATQQLAPPALPRVSAKHGELLQQSNGIAALFNVCVPLADATPIGRAVNRVMFTANTEPIKEDLKRVNVLCVDASRVASAEAGGDYTKLADKALVAEIVASLARLEAAMEKALSAKARQEVHTAPVAIVVTSNVVFQSDADDQGTLLQGALDILKVGAAFKKVCVIPLSKQESENLVKSKATLAPGIPFDLKLLMTPSPPETVPATAATATNASTAADGLKAAEAAAADVKAPVPAPKKEEAPSESAATKPARRSASKDPEKSDKRETQSDAVAAKALVGEQKAPVTAAATAATTAAATDDAKAIAAPPTPRARPPKRAPARQGKGTAGKQQQQPDFATYMEENYPADLPKHDFLWCHADLSELFQLADAGKLPPLPEGFKAFADTGVASCINLSVEWRPITAARKEGHFVWARPKMVNAPVRTIYTRILLAVADYREKFESRPPQKRPAYPAAMRMNRKKDSLVVIVPSRLGNEAALKQGKLLELALSRGRVLADLPTPQIWVMDRQTTKQFFASGFAPRVSQRFISLRANGVPAVADTTPAAEPTAKTRTPPSSSSSPPPPPPPPSSRAAAVKMLPSLPPPATPTPAATTPAAVAATTAATDKATQTASAYSSPATPLAAPPLTHANSRVVYTSKLGRPADPATLVAILGSEHVANLFKKLVHAKSERRKLIRAHVAKNDHGAKNTPKRARETAALQQMDGNLNLYAMVFKLGSASTLSTVWSNLVTAATQYASGLNDYDYRIGPAALRSGDAEPSATQAKRAQKRDAKLALDPWAGGVYVLLHIDTPVGSEGDVALMQKEVDRLYKELSPDVRNNIVLGVRLVSSQAVSEANLVFLLDSTSLRPSVSRLALSNDGEASKDGTAAPPRALEVQHDQQKALAALAEASAKDDAVIASSANPLFNTLYRRLTDISLTSAAAAATCEAVAQAADGSAAAGGSGERVAVTPGLIVAQSACVSAVVGQALEKLESRLRAQSTEMVTALQATQGANDELTRQAQSVELKNMVTDAVEEVSARHEQATAHLVKSLSAMVNQWSTEKLLNGIEAVIKDNLRDVSEFAAEAEFQKYTKSIQDTSSGDDTKERMAALDGLVKQLTKVTEQLSSSSSTAAKASSLDSERATAIAAAITDLQNDFRGVENRVSTAIQQELARYSVAMPRTGNLTMTEADVAELQKAIVSALRDSEVVMTNSGGSESASVKHAILEAMEEQAPSLLDKVESGLHRALVAAASQGLVRFAPAAAAESTNSPSPSSSSSEQRGLQERLQQRYSVRRRYALWQRRLQEQRQRKQQDGEDGATSAASGLSGEALSRVLREQRAEMMWMLRAGGPLHGHGGRRRGGSD